ncbi:MAG: hypothetical protein MK097_18035, partial [Dechloromonas sp.]|nr:hypothetical protein [Dechloromonas sp.]
MIVRGMGAVFFMIVLVAVRMFVIMAMGDMLRGAWLWDGSGGLAQMWFDFRDQAMAAQRCIKRCVINPVPVEFNMQGTRGRHLGFEHARHLSQATRQVTGGVSV